MSPARRSITGLSCRHRAPPGRLPCSPLLATEDRLRDRPAHREPPREREAQLARAALEPHPDLADVERQPARCDGPAPPRERAQQGLHLAELPLAPRR